MKQAGRLTHDQQLGVMADILKAAAKLDHDACLYVARRLIALKAETDNKAAEVLPFLPQRSAADHDA